MASEDLYRELDGEHEAPMSTPNMPPLREDVHEDVQVRDYSLLSFNS